MKQYLEGNYVIIKSIWWKFSCTCTLTIFAIRKRKLKVDE